MLVAVRVAKALAAFLVSLIAAFLLLPPRLSAGGCADSILFHIATAGPVSNQRKTHTFTENVSWTHNITHQQGVPIIITPFTASIIMHNSI